MTLNFLKTVALCSTVVLTAGAALASDEITLTDEVKQQIRTTLTDQGYEVSKIKIEDGLYEAYARKDEHRYEVFLNDKMEIVKIEDDD